MLLDSIKSPVELRKLKIDQLPELAVELRSRIIEVVASCGGHLASSLGAVELIIALHYCLNTPEDKIVFDVGHQAYAHKILTGRNREFSTLRQYQGISGFPARGESEYDVFTTGHSSNAVSLVLGLVCAHECRRGRDSNFKAAAVIGDGSLSGGLCFEGLNNAGHLKKDILVVLNTNEMSIAPSVGALSTYLNKIISLPAYNRFRSALDGFVRSRLPKGSRLIGIANKFEEGLKSLFIPGMLFEELGFRYFGPFDGHNLKLLIRTLKNISNIKGPLLMHVVTKKGKGYLPAESEPVRFHGVGPFDIKTGQPLTGKSPDEKGYTEFFSSKLVELAKNDERIVAVTAAMPEGTGLDKFRDLYPERFFDVGIAEEHAVCFSAGLARAGLKPVVALYSTFLQRAYDQIIEDVALQEAGVVFAIDRAGIAGEDGVTHQGIFDLGFLRTIPNLVIMAPKDGSELEAMLEFALSLQKPAAIRYPKASCPAGKSAPLVEGKAEILKDGSDFAIIAIGSMVSTASEAIEVLQKEGLSGMLINARFLRPLDKGLFREVCAKTKFVFTIEEAGLEAGFGSAVEEVVERALIRIGLPSCFVPHGKRDLLLAKYGLTREAIADRIRVVVR